MENVLTISAVRETYSIEEAAEHTMTIDELIDFLSQFDGDLPVVLSHDGGYTYGTLKESYFNG